MKKVLVLQLTLHSVYQYFFNFHRHLETQTLVSSSRNEKFCGLTDFTTVCPVKVCRKLDFRLFPVYWLFIV